MAARSANIGKKRDSTPKETVTTSTKSERVSKSRTSTNTTSTKEPVTKQIPSKTTTTKSTSTSVKNTSTMAPAAKRTSKRAADDEVLPASTKRSKTTSAASAPSKTVAAKPKAVAKKPAAKPAATKKAVAKPVAAPSKAASKETTKVTTKPLPAKKSPAEVRKEEFEALAEINSVPTQRLRVFACGEGSAGELGLGPKGKEVKRPRYNALLDPDTVGVVQLDAGGMHVIALTHDSKILTWGVNDLGALGRDTTWEAPVREISAEDDSDSGSDDDEADMNPRETTPTAVEASHFPEGTKFVQVAAGDSASFALTTTGLVYGWGTFRDANGVYGFTLNEKEEIIKEVPRPILIPGLTNVVAISAGADFCLALDQKGTVYGWGVGQQDQLGRRVVDRRRKNALLPVALEINKQKIQGIFAASNHAFALDTNNNVHAWGLNNYGQTGVNVGVGRGESAITAPTQVRAFDDKGIKLLSGGAHHSLALAKDGKCYMFGRMDSFQVGLDFSTLSLDDSSKVLLDDRGKPRILVQPTPLPGISFSYAAAGSNHNVAISTDGRPYSWGFSPTYQCGQGDDDEIVTPTLIDNKATREQVMVWAGAGGQYSAFASNLAERTGN